MNLERGFSVRLKGLTGKDAPLKVGQKAMLSER